MQISENRGGVRIRLTGDEVALAVHAFLVARNVNVQGPRTVTVNGDLCYEGEVFVDPCGWVDDGTTLYEGRQRV